MKKIVIIVAIFFSIPVLVQAQPSAAEVLAAKISKRMKDSLSLTDSLASLIYSINIQLHNQKSDAWQQYNYSDSLINIHLQTIENTRDSLYRNVLTEEKYLLYKSKKVNL